MRVRFYFAWYDFWVGLYFDAPKGILYFCPFPCWCFKLLTPIRILKHTDCVPEQYEIQWVTDKYWHHHMSKSFWLAMKRCIKMQMKHWKKK